MFATSKYVPFTTASWLTVQPSSQRNGYSFRFNGKELDKEGMGGVGNTYDYGFRIYNALLGKFLSVDSLTSEFPMITPYQFAENMPICGQQGLDMLKNELVHLNIAQKLFTYEKSKIESELNQ